jgi:hypothetical protein
MSLVPRLPRRAWHVLGASTFSAVGTGFVMPFTIVYLHEIRGISLATAGLAMAPGRSSTASGLAACSWRCS